MQLSVRWIKLFSISLITVITLLSNILVDVYSQEKSAQDEEVILSEGTLLTLVTAQEVSSKTAKLGDTVSFKVDEDVVVKGHVIVSKGTLAKGSVINAEESGRMGKSGKLGIQVESTTTIDGQPLRLRAAKGKEGNDKTNTVAALSSLVSSIFLLKKGGDATIKEGTKLQVYVDEEKRFRVSGSSLIAQNIEQPANANAVSAESSGVGSNSGEKMVTVYIYRPSKLVGKALEPSVFCDGVELARMDNGRFLRLKLKPGKHIIHMTDKKKGFEINMGGGQEYYFRIGIEMGMWKGHGKITLEENEKGVAEVKKLKPLDSSKIKDRTMVEIDSNIPKSDQ